MTGVMKPFLGGAPRATLSLIASRAIEQGA